MSAKYFETIGSSITMGRSLGAEDTPTSIHTAVVNRAFADKFLKGRNPVGAQFGPDEQHAREFTIVGVAENTKYRHPSEPVPPMYFTPITQTTTYAGLQEIADERYKHFANHLILHYQGDPAAAGAQLRRALAGVDPNLSVQTLHTYADDMSEVFINQRLVVRFTSLFGLLALALAALGLYGVTAYGVARRTSEIGLRIALGASRGEVVAMVLRGALGQALLGLALGLPLAFFAARLLAHTLYQTSAFQPLVLAAVTILLFFVAIVAALLPARRAASIDPIIALRSE